MENTSINLRHLLAGLSDLKEHITDLYNSLKLNLGPEATFIREWCDLKRLQLDGEAGDEIEGDTLISDILQHCWSKYVDYVWHYRGQRFRITPFKNGNDDGGFIIYYGDKHSLVSFASVVRDSVDTGTPIWEAVIARLYGLADGYANEKDLHWGEGYGVDPKEAVKVPEGAEEIKWKEAFDNAVAVKDTDGTLACADPAPAEDFYAGLDKVVEEPVPEEVPVPAEPAKPVVNQADPRPVCGGPTSTICEYCTTQMYCEAPADVDCGYRPTDATAKPKPKPNWKEKRASEKDLIKAGGPSPERYG